MTGVASILTLDMDTDVDVDQTGQHFRNYQLGLPPAMCCQNGQVTGQGDR